MFIFVFLSMIGCSAVSKNDATKDIKFSASNTTSSETKPVGNVKNDVSKELKGFDKELVNLFSARSDSYENLLPNSTELIENALIKGKISREKAAVLKVISNFDPKRLPKEYVSVEPPDTAQYDIRYLINNWNKLSKETRSEVLPYLLPIDHPQSFFNLDKKKNKSSRIKLFEEAYAAEDNKLCVQEFKHDGQKFKILYYEEKNWSEKKKQSIKNTVSYIKESIIYSWNKFKSLMKIKPSKPFIIELVELEKKLYGLEWYEEGNYRIRINILHANNEKANKSTTAHELFHAFQDEYKVGYDTPDEKWLCEATAVWAENYVYPNYNLEHAWHPRFFKTLDKERIGAGKGFEYLSYMFFYYLTDYAKTNFIRDIIKTAGQKGAKSIRPFLENNIPKLKETYSTFALYNWNWSPVDKYYDYGKITGGPSGKSFKKKIMRVEQEDKESVLLEPGAMAYYLYLFDQQDLTLQHVTITFEKSIANDKYLKRKAILKIGDKWVVEDWSSEVVKQYCRAKTDKSENIKALILVYSYANFKNKMKEPDKFRVETGKCNKEMQLSMKYDYTYKVDSFEWKAEGTLVETLEIKDHFYYVVKNSKYNFSGQGFIDGKKQIETSGSASTSITNPDIYNSLVRILKKPSTSKEGSKDIYQKYGAKENIPPQGMLMVIPPLLKEDTLKGNTTFYFPEPLRTINLAQPLPLDGISQIVALIPDLNDWNPKGINISKSIDVFKYNCPLKNIYTADLGKIAEQLDSITGIQDIDNSIKLPDSLGESFNIGGQGNINDLYSSISIINVVKDAMMPRNKTPKGTAMLKIKLNAVYTKYYGEK
ncbi:hypothetical protein [Caldicellulosiruptor owensensis]|uniref:hypothetical protein n=1 Tax=Caldicellulosiruptor owensensis TaxID=55205 RepID=UPI0011D14039|nr:hypothetical protein [Caldicellulosiruptor owensensis]